MVHSFEVGEEGNDEAHPKMENLPCGDPHGNFSSSKARTRVTMINGRAPQKELPKGILLTPFHSRQNIASLGQVKEKPNPNFLKPGFF
jgi:hypothetical protein